MNANRVDLGPLPERRAASGSCRRRHPAARRRRPDVMDAVRDGDIVELRDGALWRDGEKLAVGELLHGRRDRAAHGRRAADDRHRAAPRSPRTRSSTSTRKPSITFEPLELPPLRTKIRGRHAIVVVRGHDYKHDLAALRAVHPRVPARCSSRSTAAPTRCSTSGCTPDIIIGDFDSLSDRAMHCGAELVHHVHPDGRAPGPRAPARRRASQYEEFVAEGMSEDAAMLLAYEAGATLIVAVGTHATHGRVPRQGPAGHGFDVPHPAAARPGARRRQGREPALRGPDPPARHVVARRVGVAAMVVMVYRVGLAAGVPRRLPAVCSSDLWHSVTG